MKKHLSLFLFAVLVIKCQAQDLTLVLYNKTGQHLDSLVLDEIFLGNLDNNDSLYITELPTLTLNGPYLLHKVSAKLENNKQVKSMLGCGTKASKVNMGIYKYEIVLYENDYSETIGLILFNQ
jgi:hypothetical protein